MGSSYLTEMGKYGDNNTLDYIEYDIVSFQHVKKMSGNVWNYIIIYNGKTDVIRGSHGTLQTRLCSSDFLNNLTLLNRVHSVHRFTWHWYRGRHFSLFTHYLPTKRYNIILYLFSLHQQLPSGDAVSWNFQWNSIYLLIFNQSIGLLCSCCSKAVLYCLFPSCCWSSSLSFALHLSLQNIATKEIDTCHLDAKSVLATHYVLNIIFIILYFTSYTYCYHFLSILSTILTLHASTSGMIIYSNASLYYCFVNTPWMLIFWIRVSIYLEYIL